jgi:hypothetical protein
VTDIAYYFADVILPDDIEIFANEAGREGIENLVDGRVEWDDVAIETSGWLGTDGSKITGLPGRARLFDLLARSGIAGDHDRRRQNEIVVKGLPLVRLPLTCRRFDRFLTTPKKCTYGS